jgi:BASS family bile acid:Na+ symporter
MHLSGTLAALLVFVLACTAVVFMRHRALKSFAFTAWVFTFVAASMVWPPAFGTWLGYDLKNLVAPLVQIIMFGMGTKLSLADFVRVFVMPWPVFIGLGLHYTVMPLAGFAIAWSFGFPPEVAAGVILVGSVSSGAASNLMAYLARGNVALAVTITACSTLVSPLMTPLLMQRLAGQMVPIDSVKMVVEIFNIVIVPVVAGLIANRILYDSRACYNRGLPLGAMAAAAILLAAGAGLLPGAPLGRLAALQAGAAVGLGLIALVALTKLCVSVIARRPGNWMDRVLPLVSMTGICLIIAIITARSRERLLSVGAALIVAAMLHNAIGYLFGYWLARAVRLDEITCRTIALEVGMQNGGMASGLALGVLKSADAALAPAIFGPWMNISGSLLASWWRRRPVPGTAAGPAPARPPAPGKESLIEK